MKQKLIYILALLMLAGCSRTEKKTVEVPATRVPDSVMEKATIILTSEGLTQAIVYADTLMVFEKEDSTLAIKVKVDFFDDSGNFQSTLTSKEGLVRQKKQQFSVWGDVIVQNDTARLETQSLNWDPEKNLIFTDDFVKLNRHGDVISGYGMETDNKLSNVRILRDVKGRIQDVPSSERAIDSLEKKNEPAEIP